MKAELTGADIKLTMNPTGYRNKYRRITIGIQTNRNFQLVHLPNRNIPMHKVVMPVRSPRSMAYSGGFPAEYDNVIIDNTAVGPIVMALVEPVKM